MSYTVPPLNQRILAAMQRKMGNAKQSTRSDQHKVTNAKQSTRSDQHKVTNTKSSTRSDQHKVTNTKSTKQTEFPGINWSDTLNPDIQLCQLLYNDRIETYHQMQQMRDSLDEAAPAPDFGKQFAKLDDQNRQAQKELESYQSDKQFLYIHPITRQHKVTNTK